MGYRKIYKRVLVGLGGAGKRCPKAMHLDIYGSRASLSTHPPLHPSISRNNAIHCGLPVTND